MRDFAVGAAVLGNLSAAYFYGYAGMQIPVGLLLDRFGPRRLLAIASLICAAGCVLFAKGETLAAVTAGRFLIGASAAFSLVGAMAVAGQWFRPDRFAVFSGLAMAMGMAGGVLGQAPLRLAVEASDWRTVNLLLALGGVALCVAAWATVRDRWRGSGGFGDVLAESAHRRAQSADVADRTGRPRHVITAAGLCGALGRAVPRDCLRAAAHVCGDTDVAAVRGLGRGRAAAGMALGPHRPAPPGAVHGVGAGDGSTCSPHLRAGPAHRGAGLPVLPGRLARLGPDRLLCAGEGEPAADTERHRHRLRQRHGDGRGRAVPALGRTTARPRLVGRNRARRARLRHRCLPRGPRLAGGVRRRRWCSACSLCGRPTASHSSPRTPEGRALQSWRKVPEDGRLFRMERRTPSIPCNDGAFALERHGVGRQ